METRTIGIVGWLGKMGYWLVRYFSKAHISLLVFDIRSSKSYRHRDITICKSLHECVSQSDVVIISVPLSETKVMIEKCAPLMRNGASLIEISSIKYNTFRTLKKVKRRINLLSIHPMFGPGAISPSKQKILMIPVKSKKRELDTLTRLFADVKIIEVRNWKIHDKYMSILLSLAYYINIIFAQCLVDQDIPILKSLSGTSFAIQSLLSESMLSDEPSLITSLLTENPSTVDLLTKYNYRASLFADYIRIRDRRKINLLIKHTKNKLSKNIDFSSSYSKLYSILEALPNRRSIVQNGS